MAESRTIPPTLTRYFQEYRVEDLDIVQNADLIIGRVLEFGNRAELRWLFATYGADRIRDFVRRRGFRKLSKRAFTFWRTVLGITETECVRPPWLTEGVSVWRF